MKSNFDGCNRLTCHSEQNVENNAVTPIAERQMYSRCTQYLATASRAGKGLPGYPSSSPTPINRMHDSRDITAPLTKQPTNNLCYFFRLANPVHRRHPYRPVHGPLSGTGTPHHWCIDYPTTVLVSAQWPPKLEKL